MTVRKTSGDDIRGLVLAGVHAWGRSAFERLLPLPLMPLADSPLICYALRWLRDANVTSTVICANSESRPVRHVLGDGVALGLDLCYYEDIPPRGPAGCVHDSGSQWPARDLVVVEGSIIPALDLHALLEEHRQTGAIMTIAVEQSHEQTDSATAFLCPVGVYVVAERALNRISPVGYQDIKEVLIPALHDAGEQVRFYQTDEASPRVAGLATYMLAHEWACERLAAGTNPLPTYHRHGQALVHEQAEVARDAEVIGPVLIGPGTRIAPRATIIGPTAIGQDCTMEEDTVVCRSAIWDRCVIERGSRVDHCLLAFEAQVKPGICLRDTLHVHNVQRGARRSPLGQTAHPDPTAPGQHDAASRIAQPGEDRDVPPVLKERADHAA